jgi:tRNA (guanine-N7-)-methyltransferase
MVSTGMKRYRQRSAAQASLIDDGIAPLDPQETFGRCAPLRLEIGFGHGEFLSQMAALHPDEDFLGVEAKPLRVTKTAHWSLKRGATNVHLYQDEAHRFVRHRLPPGCLHRAYILFPDPWPKRRHRRRRLVNRSFLLDLARAMAPGGRFVFASDTHNYVFQVLSHLATLPGLWINRYAPDGYRFDIPTRFPTVFQRHKVAEGCSIGYLLMERSQQPAPEPVAGPGRERQGRLPS